MKWLYKNKNQINYILLFLVFTTLVISNNLNSMCIIAFSAFNVLWLNNKSWNSLIKDKLIIALAIVFGIYVLSYFLTENTVYAQKVILKNISFLILPSMIFLAINESKSFNLKKLLRLWVYLLGLFLLLALIISFYKNYLFNIQEGLPVYKLKSWYFTYHYIAGNINISAIYLSLYIGFALLLVAIDYFGFYDLGFKIKPQKKIFIIIYFLTFLFLLSARTTLFMTLVILIAIFYRGSIKMGKSIYFFIVTGLLFTILGILIYNNDVLRIRLINAFKFYEDSKYFSGGLSSRLYQWQAIIDQFINENYFIGFGIGDAKAFYLEAYKEANLKWALNQKFNAHNMYLETLFTVGVIGLASLIYAFWISVRRAVTTDHLPYIVFLVLFLSAGLTESILNRHHGILYFIIFNCLFYFNLKFSTK